MFRSIDRVGALLMLGLYFSGCSTFPINLESDEAAFDEAVAENDGGFCDEVEQTYGTVEGCSLNYSYPKSAETKYVAELDCDVYGRTDEKSRPVGTVKSGTRYDPIATKEKDWSTIGTRKFVRSDCFVPETEYEN